MTPKAPAHPDAIAGAYARALARATKGAARGTADAVAAAYGAAKAHRGDIATPRTDAPDPGLASILAALKKRREAWENLPKQLDLFGVYGQTDRHVTRENARYLTQKRKARYAAVLRSFTPDAKQRDKWIRENVGLIKTIPARYFDQVEKIVREKWAAQSLTPALIDALEQADLSAGWNAERIARDQVGKLNAQIASAKLQKLGIDRYEWSTSNDERVRPSHKAKDGRVFLYSAPPPDTGHPGHDILCRCSALPIIPEDEPRIIAQFAKGRK